MSPYKHVISACVVAGAVVSFAPPAQAYLDPGTGSMVLQLVLGGVAGIMVVGKLYWARIKGLFGFSADKVTPSEEADKTHVK